MWWLADLLITQSQASPSAVDPWALAAGGGGAFGIVMLLVGRLDKLIDAWAKKRNGGDHDSVAKETTRAQVNAIHKATQEHADAMVRLAQSLERQAEALRDTRRQNSDEHHDLANLIRDRGR